MTRQRQHSLLSTTLVMFILLTIAATLCPVSVAHAQYFPPSPLDYLFLANPPAYYPAIGQVPVGLGLINPLQVINSQVYQATGSGYYPDSIYYPSAAGTAPAVNANQYIANTTGYYSIESVGCTCNL